MPVCNLYDLINAISPGQKVLGLDIGKKTIGLAIADPRTNVASPQPVLWRKKFTPDAEHLIRLIDKQNVGGLVLGWPLNMDGTAGPRCDLYGILRMLFCVCMILPSAFRMSACPHKLSRGT